MNFLIVTHVQHKLENGQYYGYGPYVKEMNIWNAQADYIEVIAHKIDDKVNRIDLSYLSDIRFTEIPQISLTSFKEIMKSFLYTPYIFFKIIHAMRRADHIHLRCPGNIGLIGCIAQMFFPKKKKTAKYAGNWDPKAKQPSSYRLQKWILRNTILTKNMSAIVYGEWPGQSKNIIPFFTATYTKDQIPSIRVPHYEEPYEILFVGTLSEGKRPLYVLQWAKECLARGIQVKVHYYGEGNQRPILETYIKDHKLEKSIILHGNQNSEVVQNAYKKAHFMILPSKSEGWPKVIAEAMFWGVIPLATPISCVPWMLGDGTRGLLLDVVIDKDVSTFAKALKNPKSLQQMAVNGQEWSHQYTLDKFETSVKEFL